MNTEIAVQPTVLASAPDRLGQLLARHRAYIEHLVDNGGPDPREYDRFTAWQHQLGRAVRQGELSAESLKQVQNAFGDALSLETMQGFVLRKPHGYAGDFETMDRIYTRWLSPNPRLQKWDLYFHSSPAVEAVRNRKTYAKNLFKEIETSSGLDGQAQVLNLASGPARDLHEYFMENPSSRLRFDCVELDPKAIAYARALGRESFRQVRFHEANALRFNPSVKYRLIWSAGLFDYFRDKTFGLMLRRLLGMLEPSGELVVGNFDPNNPTRDYMELVGEWVLHYRTPEDLTRLALESGVGRDAIRIEAEPTGINLFLRIRPRDAFGSPPDAFTVEAPPSL